MNVSSVKNLNGEVFSAVQDASLTNVVQSNSAQWAEGGGGSVSSKYGTIMVSGSNIEVTNKAIEFKDNGFTSSFNNTALDEHQPSTSTFTWYDYSEGTTLTLNVLNHGNSDNLTYSSNTNVTGLITAAQWTPTDVSLSIPNATAIQFSADHGYDLQSTRVSAPSSFKVSELAWKSDIPTYTYNSDHKLSAINGSALVGNEDYLVKQGFVQNLTSPKGTISVLHNNKIEGTNSAISSDVIEGFVSAYYGMDVTPVNSATLSWSNYIPNTVLHVSGSQYSPATYTYSADTGVTGQIVLPDSGETSIEVPTNATSMVIRNENWNNLNPNFTVSAADYYEIGELAWASAIPTYEYDSTNKISAINGSAIAGGSGVIGNDETVLWEGSAGTGTNLVLSENYNNFDRLRFEYRPWSESQTPSYQISEVGTNYNNFTLGSFWNNNDTYATFIYTYEGDGTNKLNFIKGAYNNGNNWTNAGSICMFKIVGINRISGSNA